MKPQPTRVTLRSVIAVLCSVLILPGDTVVFAQQQTTTPPSTSAAPAAPIPPEQLDSLVAPIALYPDPLLAQVLAASTYPLEIILLQRWLEKNKNLKGKDLADAVAKQTWDESVQALAPMADVVKRLGDDIQWTADLGNAFLAQQSGVMDAVQRMRQKAQEKGTLKTSEQQTVETKVIENKTVVVIEPSKPDVIYVPSYDPVVVYGAPYYPYPPIYYPPYGYYAAGAAIAFGVGVAMGAFWSGGWGWGCGWGNNNININNNFNNFNRNTNINGGNRVSNQPAGGRGNSNWSHNPQHRGGTPYRDRGTADRFGGSARGDSLSQRQVQRGGTPGNGNLSSRVSNTGLANRGGAGAGIGGGSRADSIGSRDLSRSGGGDRNAFAGGSRDYSGSSARSNSSRGSSSLGSRSSGGFSRGGGGGRRR